MSQALLAAIRKVAPRIRHADDCQYQRWLLDYSKGRGPCPDEGTCDCGVYDLLSLLEENTP